MEREFRGDRVSVSLGARGLSGDDCADGCMAVQMRSKPPNWALHMGEDGNHVACTLITNKAGHSRPRRECATSSWAPASGLSGW